MTQSKFISNLFFEKEGEKLVLFIAKILEDLKAAGVDYNANFFF